MIVIILKTVIGACGCQEQKQQQMLNAFFRLSERKSTCWSLIFFQKVRVLTRKRKLLQASSRTSF